MKKSEKGGVIDVRRTPPPFLSVRPPPDRVHLHGRVGPALARHAVEAGVLLRLVPRVQRGDAARVGVVAAAAAENDGLARDAQAGARKCGDWEGGGGGGRVGAGAVKSARRLEACARAARPRPRRRGRPPYLPMPGATRARGARPDI